MHQPTWHACACRATGAGLTCAVPGAALPKVHLVQAVDLHRHQGEGYSAIQVVRLWFASTAVADEQRGKLNTADGRWSLRSCTSLHQPPADMY